MKAEEKHNRIPLSIIIGRRVAAEHAQRMPEEFWEFNDHQPTENYWQF